jgi:hypothetical protein
MWTVFLTFYRSIIMKTNFIIATLISIASLGATAVFAQEYTPKNEPEKLITSKVPRAEVKEEVRKAAKEKTLPVVSEAGPKAVIDKSTDHTRAEQKAAVRKANKERKLPVVNEAGVTEPK